MDLTHRVLPGMLGLVAAMVRGLVAMTHVEIDRFPCQAEALKRETVSIDIWYLTAGDTLVSVDLN